MHTFRNVWQRFRENFLRDRAKRRERAFVAVPYILMLYSNKFNQNILIICTLLGTYGSDFKILWISLSSTRFRIRAVPNRFMLYRLNCIKLSLSSTRFQKRMVAISREFFTRSCETPRALYRHTRRGERIVFARCREKGSESACAYCARFCFYLIKKAKARRTNLFNEILFVHFDFYLFNCAQYAYLQVCGALRRKLTHRVS